MKYFPPQKGSTAGAVLHTKAGFSIVTVMLVVVVLAIGLILLLTMRSKTNIPIPAVNVVPPPPAQPVAIASYACEGTLGITAAFFEKEKGLVVVADQPPTPTGHVTLTLNDGRVLVLAQTVSADGARYGDATSSAVFLSKGRSAVFIENNGSTTAHCIEVVADAGSLPSIFASSTRGISLRYPSGYVVDDKYSYTALGPKKSINGVKFTIPLEVATGTNLSNDTYVSIEQVAQSAVCSAGLFLSSSAATSTIHEGVMTYSYASSSGAAAGNRYEEMVYAFPGTAPCTAVRYFIHYGVFENYASGTVAEFDKAHLLSQFDAVRRTLIVAE